MAEAFKLYVQGRLPRYLWHNCVLRSKWVGVDDLCGANLDMFSAFMRGASEGEIQGRFKG